MSGLIVGPKGQETPISTRDALGQYGFKIGAFSYGVPTVWWWHEPATLVIGKFCSFANAVEILLGGNHRTDWVTTYPFANISHWPEAAHIKGHPATNGDVIIGNDVWIGYKATILSGVTIGDGAVIGAYAMVTRNVPAYAIVAGNPARTIRMRFPDHIIQQLLKVRWWDWDLERIRRSIPLLMQSDISKFLEECGSTDSN
jgi:acetyltransferase-like isoleucine patch superfamily enzyme